MNTSKLLIASIIGAIVNFLGGWVIYGMLLEKIMKENMTPEAQTLHKTEPNLAGIFVAGLIMSLLFAYIFEKYANIRTLVGGAVLGAIMGALITLSIDIQFWSMLTIFSSMNAILFDLIGGTVLSALVGAAIGWFLGFNRKD